MGVLVGAQGALPVGADGGGVEHEVGFLRVEPGLGVLVAVALDAEVGVGDQEFDWMGGGEGRG